MKKIFPWLLAFMLLILGMISYLDRSTLSIANTVIAETFDIPPMQMGILLSAFMWPYAIANLPSGYLVDKYGINKIMAISITGWSIACILSGFVTGFYTILMTRILLGIAEAPFFIIATKVIQEHFSPSKRGLASSIVSLGPRIASVIAPVFIVLLIALISWRGMFILLGIIGAILGVIWYMISNKSFKKIELQNRSRKTTSFVKCFKNKNVILLCLGNFGSSYAYWVFVTWLPYYFIHTKGLDLSQMGLAASATFVLALASVMLGGIISDMFISAKTNVIKSRLVPIIFGCAVAGLSIIILPFIDNLTISIVIISISIFCLGLRISPIWALVADISSKESVGTVGGIQNFANFIGAGLAPLLTGIILSYDSESFTIVFLISGVICLLASFCYFFIKNTEFI
ncbi:MFS transporter [Francisella adeliensis]|uniref:MFS transporter n=1 Tax=Francisella adeliensis TaxID=2007306 RepID=A0A2Z4XZZ1_9GAMM|nr:MFS transporter [Francisella adeliensis]AXA34467.1 MFS transporter [Francisella adeliensis]MBK2086186.1 MFS transporter [Francisella adeliensis]MBK2096403.1 MFS transporter [Francisella adeliensis]QIW12714.1 MFS transporter [Francisella adeliensis]QIW14590.1 MFS transporter [Francisella adeliensis]